MSFFINFLAEYSVGAVFIDSGAEFQSLAESLLTLSLAAFDLLSSFQIFIEEVLICLPPSFLPGYIYNKIVTPCFDSLVIRQSP